ncbi:signal peptidase I [Paenibacillus anaericanus]|uniref:Signal peptidase I n=1 Tax=Paenibacillus anaericanus TaxID=170367 RepID=A0A3S1D641_9BACL|nr:signal peptidase I [Paenibacillus anaericanus]RUT37851.1 signal peptidase I [Paenibacillus anaericanus]
MEPVIPSGDVNHTNEQDKAIAAEEILQSKKTWLVELWDFSKTILIAFVVMLLLNIFVFNLSLVKGQSMEPTLENQERLFVNKLVYHIGSPKSGDVVVLKDPSTGSDRKMFLVKRVVAEPGDTVEIREHKLLVNGQSQDEPYTDVQIQDSDIKPLTLGENEYFVMGDNRHAGRSKDSRSFGSVKSEQIVGRAEFVFWPISKIRGL